MKEPTVCIITDDIRRQARFKTAFGTSTTLHFAENCQAAISIIKNQLIGCVIIPVYITSLEELKPITAFRNHFSHIPLILYGKVADKYLCFKLGKIGIEDYFESGQLKELVDKVHSIIEQRKFKIDFKKFGVDMELCPITIKRALKIIEKDFLSIKTVMEIAEKLNVSLNHLEREFTGCCNISCKKLLIGLRLYYAVCLMENKQDSTLAQIAAESGFKESRSFYRSFLKHSGITASRYRKNQLSKDFPEIFKKNVNRKKK